jgi:hypothetical protein
MSERYPGGIISQTAPVPSGPYQNSTAPGVWTLEQQAYWTRLGQWPTAGNLPNYVEDVFSTYLYTGYSQPQAINNGIALGNGYVGGATGGSGLFDGVNDYLSVPTGTALNLPGDFTIEAWIYQTTNPVYYGIFGNGDYPSTAQITFTVTWGNVQLFMSNGSGWAVTLISTAAIPLFAWTHVAVTCSGSTFTIWLNGVNSGSTTYSGARATPEPTTVIGRLYPGINDYYFAGNMSNLRVVKGTALYTTNFTPPSSALTAVSGTQLLCLQGSTPFVDNSPNALTITNNNGTVVSALGPFPFTSVTGKGGLVWIKNRSNSLGFNNVLQDSERGFTTGKKLSSNLTVGQNGTNITDDFGYISGATATGFTLNQSGSGSYNWFQTNASNNNYVSWTFREQAKFFDVVTYTGNGGTQVINHNLGSTPGMIIIKRTDTASILGWITYHRSLTNPNDNFLVLNSTTASASAPSWISPTSTNFTIGPYSDPNANGGTFVAYLFAHNAGGFGTSGTDNVISCGSFTTDGSGNATVNLGYEPQYILCKYTTTSPWYVFDTMRGFSLSAQTALFPNTASVENTYTGTGLFPTATGFSTLGTSLFDANATLIYMAIRRPMKTPTSGTEVFSPSAVNVSAGTAVSTGFPIDWQINYYRSFAANYNSINATRLLGTSSTSTESGQVLWTSKTDAQTSFGMTRNWNNTGFEQTSQLWPNNDNIYWNFRRAPGFFDVVCYSGNSVYGQTYTHNLGVTPELIIIKARNSVRSWPVYPNTLSSSLYLNLSGSGYGTRFTSVSATTFGVSNDETTNFSGINYVAYLFATCPGVSKVGSYAGTGATQTINCGFTSGARFVLIKRSSDSGGWYVWDTARGMVAGTDPFLALNTTSAESNINTVYTATTGFQIVGTDPELNASGSTYIYLAIA